MKESAQNPTLCPSAQPEMAGSKIIGVINGTVEQPHLVHLAKPLPVTPEVLALTAPVNPTEVFRFAASCAEKSCQHFDGSRCRLAEQIVGNLSPVVETLPACSIRSSCRWWKEQGKAACFRCPQIATENHHYSETLQQATDPSVYSLNS